MKLYLAIMVAVAAVASSCGQTEFAGGTAPARGSKGDQNKVTPSDAPAMPADKKSTPETPPLATNTDPVVTPATSTPTVDQESTTRGPGFLDIFGDLVKKIREAEIVEKDDEIIFGGAKVFHIGDGDFSSSSCKVRIVTYQRTGKIYYFEFNVLEDNTQVDINIETICGVDYAQTNFIALMQGTKRLIEQNVPAGADSLRLPPQTLARGTYQIQVESRVGDPKNPTDFDDFVVGRLHVKGNKKVTAGSVGARD